MRTHSQRGMALVVALIMLALMTVMAIASFNVGKVSMEIIGNMQQRNEVITAANSTIQEAISKPRLFETPSTALLNPCGGVANTRCYDLNADGTDDITVRLTPAPVCIQSQIIPNASLNFTTVGASDCTLEDDATKYGIEGAATGTSLCANSLWEVTAVATDAVTSASVTVVEGVAVLVEFDEVPAFCP